MCICSVIINLFDIYLVNALWVSPLTLVVILTVTVIRWRAMLPIVVSSSVTLVLISLIVIGIWIVLRILIFPLT